MNTCSKNNTLLIWCIKSLLFTVLLLLSKPGLCQEHGFVVTGKGTVEVDSDIAYLTASIQTQGQSVENVAEENKRLLKQIMDKLKEAGVSAKNVTVSKMLFQPAWPSGPMSMGGIRAFRKIHLTEEAFSEERLAKLLDLLVSSGASVFPSPEFRGPGLGSAIVYSIKDQEKYKEEALKKALADARNKAEALSKTLGISLPVKMIVKYSTPEISFDRNERYIAGSMDMASLPERFRDMSVSFDGDKVKISVSVTVSYGNTE